MKPEQRSAKSAVPDPLDPAQMMSLRHWEGGDDAPPAADMITEAVVDCGWGRLIFGQTFATPQRLVDILRDETVGQRDIALYIRDPQVVVALAPQDLFIDPSFTYRLDLRSSACAPAEQPWRVRPALPGDAPALRRIYQARGMVVPPAGFLEQPDQHPQLLLLVAEDPHDGGIVGVVTGVDHRIAFNDPDHGASLWALAVDPQAPFPGIGEGLSRHLADEFRQRGRAFLDLSVLHDNTQAISLYEKLGFVRVPVYCVKKKNPINEPLFVGPDPADELNIYARIIVREARRRGIAVEVLDAPSGFFRLSLGGRALTCRESLSELTSAIAMTRCDDKRLTLHVLRQAGLSVPEQIDAGDDDAMAAFLARHRRVVVKPARGEQGKGVRVDIRDMKTLRQAVEFAAHFSDHVIVEQMVEGDDLRIIVIDHEVVAAATRRPAEVTGDGSTTVRDLIERQSRRRALATAGESRIPMDAETDACLAAAGLTLDSVLPAGQRLAVRKTANLHTGGTIHDVTAQLHPVLREAAVAASRALEIPVVGFDFMVPSPDRPDYTIIEANERPGLANHEPQPTAERFVDLLFPQTRAA